MTFASFETTCNVHCHSIDGSNIEDIPVDLEKLLSAYSKHAGSRSTDAHRELTERDSMVKDIFIYSKGRATCIATLSMEVLLRI